MVGFSFLTDLFRNKSRTISVFLSIACSLIALLLVVAFCNKKKDRPLVVLRGRAMGTTWQVSVADFPSGSKVDQQALQSDIASCIEHIEAQMSHWREDSHISRFNRAAADHWLKLPHETGQVIQESLRLSRETNGAFDITAATLVNLWGFGPGGPRSTLPDEAEIVAAGKLVGSRWIELDCSVAEKPRLRKTLPGVQIDLSAIAKGYAIDQVDQWLTGHGYEHYLIELGGELKSHGLNNRKLPWNVGLEMPTVGRQNQIRGTIQLKDMAIATSGDYRLFLQSADLANVSLPSKTKSRLSHIIDPRTGRPCENGLVSVSVVAQSAMRADGLATALMVLGPEAGIAFARQHELAVSFVVRHQQRLLEINTPSFQNLRQDR